MKDNNIYWSDIHIADGKDSSVYTYKTRLWTQAYKIYQEHISATLLQDYHALHQYFSECNFLSIPTDLSYKNQKVEYIQWSILPLDTDNICLCSDRENQKKYVTSQIPYIPGETLYELLINLDNWHSRSTLILELEKIFQDNIIQAYPNLKPDNKRERFIDLHNIKVVSRKNGTLACIITDLGKSIIKLLDIKKKERRKVSQRKV